MKELEVHIVGTRPTMMHNGQLSDPLNKYAQAIKAISGKRKKSDDDHKEMGKIEVIGSLYLGGNPPRPVWPAKNIHAMLVAAAKRFKAGPIVKSSISVIEDAVLEYDGPTDPNEIAENDDFVDRRRCGVQNSSVFRSRPIFKDWELKFRIIYDEEAVNQRDIEDWLEVAGTNVGLSDHRPYYGLFEVVSVKNV